MTAFPTAQFKIIFPQFKDVDDDIIEAVAQWAQCYVDEYGCVCTLQLWMLMVAHLLTLRLLAEEGDGAATGAVVSASIDKVSVSYQAPASKDAWTDWLNLTSFGQEFLALMKRCAVGGIFVGGSGERDAFTGAYGLKGGRGWFR